jgi:hypothetical protein
MGRREGLLLEGNFRGLATEFATSHLSGRNRWQTNGDPIGFGFSVDLNSLTYPCPWQNSHHDHG